MSFRRLPIENGRSSPLLIPEALATRSGPFTGTGHATETGRRLPMSRTREGTLRIRAYSLALSGLFAVLLTVGAFAFWSANTTNRGRTLGCRHASVRRLRACPLRGRCRGVARAQVPPRARVGGASALCRRAKGSPTRSLRLSSADRPSGQALVAKLLAKQRGYLVRSSPCSPRSTRIRRARARDRSQRCRSVVRRD